MAAGKLPKGKVGGGLLLLLLLLLLLPTAMDWNAGTDNNIGNAREGREVYCMMSHVTHFPRISSEKLTHFLTANPF